MTLPISCQATRVTFSIFPAEEPPASSLHLSVDFPNLGAAENESLDDAANAAALAAHASLDAAYPANSFTLLRRYEGVEPSQTDITPS
jgi:hypothetical protein